MQQPTAPTAKHDSLTGKLLRRVAKINKAAEVEKGEKKAGIISGVTGKLYLALRPPTMGELDEWISCANIEALEMSIKYHPKEVSGLASLSTNPNTILTGMLEALRKKSAEAFFGLLKRMGITVEDDIRRGISKILLEYLNWNYSSVPTIHMLVTFVANNNLIPETGLIPTEKKAEVEKKMNQHLYYWLTYHSSHIKEEVHIGKQILELAPHFGISIHIEKIMAEIMKRAGISLYMTRSIEWIAENDIEVAEATFQGLVNCASHNTSGYTFQASGWIKSAKIHSQKKGWNIDFEGPTMNEVVYILTHRPGGNNGESLDAIINDKMPALNFQPPREGAAESDEQPKTPDRSKWKPAILDQFAEMCTFFYRSGHFMYGPRFDIIGKCLEAAKAIGIDIDEKEMITAARGACIEKILAEGTSNSYYNIDLCAEYELRADELGCKKATYSAEFLDIIRAKIARRFGSKGDYTEIPSLVRFAQKIGVDVHQNSG